MHTFPGIRVFGHLSLEKEKKRKKEGLLPRLGSGEEWPLFDQWFFFFFFWAADAFKLSPDSFLETFYTLDRNCVYTIRTNVRLTCLVCVARVTLRKGGCKRARQLVCDESREAIELGMGLRVPQAPAAVPCK